MGKPDPLLQLLKDFSYNVVRLPRANIRPMQILEKQGNDLVVLGDISDLFLPGEVSLPDIGPDDPATFINGHRSSDLKIGVGLSLLRGIISALSGLKIQIDAAYKRASAMAFEFHDVVVNQVNQLKLSRFLTAARIDKTVGPPAQLLEADELFIITSTIKSKKFTAEAKTSSGVSASVDVPVLKEAVAGSVSINIEGANDSKITYEGQIPLVFGFQAVRMEFENEVFKGFASVKPDAAAMRVFPPPTGEAVEQPEMLSTSSPFVSFIAKDEMVASPSKPRVKKPRPKTVRAAKRGKTKPGRVPPKKKAKKPTSKVRTKKGPRK